MNIGGTISGAVFSEDRKKRFALWRVWDKARPALLFVGLNPSTATDRQDDPTIRRVVGFAKAWYHGGLYVGNLFSTITPDPRELYLAEPEPTAPTDEALQEMRAICPRVLVGWGHFGKDAQNRTAEVLALLGKPVYCLGTTKDGWPKHPLYMRADTEMKLYERGKI